MMTKDQERQALEEIKKILGKIGKDSYIGMAFEGCIEDAESNIDNDFGDSWKARAEHLSAENNELQDKVAKYAKDLVFMRVERDKEKQEREKAEELAEIQRCNALTLNESLATEKAENARLKVQVEELRQEIIRLKARLYDLMTQESGQDKT